LRVRVSVLMASAVRRCVVLVRHGDRSPAFNPFLGGVAEASHTALWERATRDGEGDGRPPVHAVINANASVFDHKAAPWQQLTRRGAEQMRWRGEQLVRGIWGGRA